MQPKSLYCVRFLSTRRSGYRLKDYYKVLNVPRNSHISQIKRAYIELSKKYHPDGNSLSSNSTEFVKIYEAYRELCKQAPREIKTDPELYSVPKMNHSLLNQKVQKSWMNFHGHKRQKQPPIFHPKADQNIVKLPQMHEAKSLTFKNPSSDSNDSDEKIENAPKWPPGFFIFSFIMMGGELLRQCLNAAPLEDEELTTDETS